MAFKWTTILCPLCTILRIQKILRNLGTLQCAKETVPICRSARQEDVPGFRILADKNFLGIKAKSGGQAHSLLRPLANNLATWLMVTSFTAWYISKYIHNHPKRTLLQ